jgi:hypothetical protein
MQTCDPGLRDILFRYDYLPSHAAFRVAFQEFHTSNMQTFTRDYVAPQSAMEDDCDGYTLLDTRPV